MPVLAGTSEARARRSGFLGDVLHVRRHSSVGDDGHPAVTPAGKQALLDAVAQGALTAKLICRTFSDCTTAPRNGLVSGCYPLDEAYKHRPEAKKLREIKRGAP